MWSILTRDYEYGLDKEKAAARIIKQIKPGDIIVLHDSERAEKNMLYLLHQILLHFSGLQYRFLAL